MSTEMDNKQLRRRSDITIVCKFFLWMIFVILLVSLSTYLRIKFRRKHTEVTSFETKNIPTPDPKIFDNILKIIEENKRTQEETANIMQNLDENSKKTKEFWTPERINEVLGTISKDSDWNSNGSPNDIKDAYAVQSKEDINNEILNSIRKKRFEHIAKIKSIMEKLDSNGKINNQKDISTTQGNSAESYDIHLIE